MRSQSSGECVVVGMGLSRWLGWVVGTSEVALRYMNVAVGQTTVLFESPVISAVYISVHTSVLYICVTHKRFESGRISKLDCHTSS